MKTTRILIPVLSLAAAASLVAQALPGAAPVPKGKTPAPKKAPAPPEAFPAPGDPTPTPPAEQPPAPKAPAPAVQPQPSAPAIGPNPVPNPTVIVPLVQPPLIVPQPPAPAPAPAGAPPVAVNPLNEPRAEPFIGLGKINGIRVSARGRPTIFSALIFQFNKNEPVNIIEQIVIKNPKAGEPRKWFRVQMPLDTGAWVHGNFLGQPFTKNVVNAAGQAVPLKYAEVTANLLNVRGGAGENFPVVSKLRKGTIVRLSTQKKGKWVELFAPANSSVFVAAQFVTTVPLNAGVVEVPGAPVQPVPPVQPIPPVAGGTLPQPPVQPGVQPKPIERIIPVPLNQFGQPSGLAPDGTPIKRAGTPGTVNSDATPTPPVQPKPNTPSIAEVQPKPPITPAPQPGEAAKPGEPVTPAPQPKEPTELAETNEKPATPTVAAKPEAKPEPPVRIVTREGVVRRTRELQSPTGYMLVHLESGKKINYLMLNRPDIKLNWFLDQTVLLTGQEAIDPRAANTPVLKVKTLQGDVSPKAIQEFIVAREKARRQAAEKATQPEPEAPQPETEKPEVPQPEGEKPEVPQPEGEKPEAPKPEGEKPDAPKPSAPAEPKEDKPETPKPEGEKPESPKSEPENQVDNK